MIKLLTILTSLLLLSACVSNKVPNTYDITDQLQKCVVYSDHIECTLINGDTYRASQIKLNMITMWDKSAWKEENETSIS